MLPSPVADVTFVNGAESSPTQMVCALFITPGSISFGVTVRQLLKSEHGTPFKVDVATLRK